jgi:hypothetical protein
MTTPNAKGWSEYRRLLREGLTPPEAYDRVLTVPENQYPKPKRGRKK